MDRFRALARSKAGLTLVLASVLCSIAYGQGQHPSAWETGVQVTSFEGDVYTALNLSSTEATQFGALFSSALYGLAVGDACQQISEGKIADGLKTLTWASGEFAIGFTPVGWAYAALKLLTAAPPAIVNCLVDFNVSKGFDVYKASRTKRGGHYGLPVDMIDFTSAKYKEWRAMAPRAFEDLWDKAVLPGYGAYRPQAIDAIKKERMSRFGFWDKYLSPREYMKARTSAVSDPDVKTWTFANWEARVVVDVLTNEVPKRLEAARTQMMITQVDILCRLVDLGGNALDVEEFFIAGGAMSPRVRDGRVIIETTIGDLPDIAKRRFVKFSAKLKGKEDKVTGSIDVSDLTEQKYWRKATELKQTVIKIDLGDVAISTGKRRVEVNVNAAGVENAVLDLGRAATRDALQTVGAQGGKITLELPPGTHTGTFSGTGNDGRPVMRMAIIEVPLPWEGDPPPVTVALDNASAIAASGAIGAIKTAINSNATKLRTNAISPQEYNHAVTASIAKAEGTVKQADGTEKPASQVAREEAQKQSDELRREGESDLEQRARALRDQVLHLPEKIPTEYRGAFGSSDSMNATVEGILREVQPVGDTFPYGPTRAMELTIEHFERQGGKLEELLGPVVDDVASDVTAARAEFDAIIEDYERGWALLTFADGRLDGAIRGMDNGDLVRWEETLATAKMIKQAGLVDRVKTMVESLNQTLAERGDMVREAEAAHAAMVSKIESFRTVTLTDVAMVSSTLSACPGTREAAQYLMLLDRARIKLESAKDGDVQSRADAARSLAGAVVGVERVLADEGLLAVLEELKVSFPPGDPAEPGVARVADRMYRLSGLQRRIARALEPGREIEAAYKAFHNANRSLLEDRFVDDEALRIPAGTNEPKPSTAWFPGRRLIPDAEMGDNAPYDFAALNTLRAKVRDPFAGTNLTEASLELLEDTEEDKPAYLALHKEMREALAPYLALRGTAGGSNKQLSAALNEGLELRNKPFGVLGAAMAEGRAPFHQDKLSELLPERYLPARRYSAELDPTTPGAGSLARPHLDGVADATLEVLAQGDAGYVALAERYYAQQIAAIGKVQERIDALVARVGSGWADPAATEHFLWAESFKADLMAAADLGPSGNGDPDLAWQGADTRAWVVVGAKEAMAAGDEAVGRAWNDLWDAQKGAEAAYARIFSNAARLTKLPAERTGPLPKAAPSNPRAGTARKVLDANPAIGKIAWSPDGKVIAWHHMIGSTSMIPAAGGTVQTLTRPDNWFGGSGTAPAFSPNGALLVQEGPWERMGTATVELVFRKADGSGLQRLIKFKADEVGVDSINRMQVAPDGRLFLSWSGADGSGYGWLDTDTGELNKIVVSGGTMDADLSADGKRIVYTQAGTKKLMVADAGGNARDLGLIARDPAISPTGKWIAYCYGDSVMIVSASGGKARELFRRSGVSLLSWSPRGDAIAYRRWGEGEVGLWVTPIK